MTKFIKENFYINGAYVDYNIGDKSRFVARFKYSGGGKSSFITFLIKNFTVEEYFARMDAGEAPLTIVQSKGYLLPHIKKELRRVGYPVTAEGFKKMIADQVATYSKPAAA